MRDENLPTWFLWILQRPLLALLGIPVALLLIAVGVAMYLDQRITHLTNDQGITRVEGEPSGATPSHLPREIASGQTVYVPLYSHVYESEGKRLNLAGTLSIRNTDPEHSITVSKVSYYNTQGKLIREYSEQPLRLNPLGSHDFFIPQSDTKGGAGANFLVEWVSEKPAMEPIIEAVMVGRNGEGISTFVRAGQVIKQLD